MTLLHGSCVAIGGRGVLIQGPSGSGKSDLALRLIDGGAELVADDYVEISQADGLAYAQPPEPLAGLLEVRGLGLVRLPFRPHVPVLLIVELVEANTMERLPEPRRMALVGIDLPLVRLWAFEPSAAAKVRICLDQTDDKEAFGAR